ncbi:DNA primase large subunit Spp2 [Malassezia sp. CBS 17886]|nr:DNA primase large subunit Spp2 [Malassezia sp. CBS 17886]
MSMRGGDGGGRAAVSFSLAGRAADARTAGKTRPGLHFSDDHEDAEPAVRDVPLGVKRKREVAAAPPPADTHRVIPLQTAADWRDERKRRLGLLDRHASSLGSLASMRPPGKQATNAPPDAAAQDNEPERAFDEPQQRGLVTRAADEGAPGGDRTPPAVEAGESPSASPSPPPPENADAAAIRALLAESSGEKRERTGGLVIAQPTDEDMFRNDVDGCPEEPTLDDYSAMPIDEFGAAMLRGMGWHDGKGVGKSRSGPVQAPEVKKRAALLGLGAKERATPGSARNGVSRSTRPDPRYVPVVRRGAEGAERAEGRGRMAVDAHGDNEVRREDRYGGDARRGDREGGERRREDRYGGGRRWEDREGGERRRGHRDGGERRRGDRYGDDRPRKGWDPRDDAAYRSDAAHRSDRAYHTDRSSRHSARDARY